ncbi:MAG: helix-hairpin-helix domain-containing protein [Bacteroidota bacterium]
MNQIAVDKQPPQASALVFCLLALLFLLPHSTVWGQNDTLPIVPVDESIDQSIEDLILNTESEAQVDYSDLTDELEALLLQPLNLNQATYDQLLQLPGMNAIQANRLLEHIRKFGRLTTIYELQAIPGYTPNFIRQFLPYVSVLDSQAKDINPSVKHPKGPSLQQIRRGLKGEFMQRAVWNLETARGYTDPDTSFRDRIDEEGRIVGQDTLLSSRYAGSAMRHYSRLRINYGKNVSFGIVGEKDPGEEFAWRPESRLYGYDYLSAHFALAGFGRLKSLVIGDYTLQVGQGMVLSRGLGFGKGAQVINSIKMPNQGIRPYRSVNENQYLRGAAATYALGDFYMTAFASRQFVDASVSERDTLDDEVLLAGGLQTSGLHRTPSELSNRKAVQEQMYGGRLEYKTPTLTVGTTHYYQQYSSPLSRPLNDYNQFDFRGDRNYINALDFDWVWQNFNLFGEFARSQSGGTGASVGIMGSIAPTVDISILARRYDIDFHSNKGYVFAERPTAIQNESGIYIGLRYAPNPRWTLNTYFDQFYFPWNKFRASYPSRGWEFMSQLEFKPKRGTLIYARYRIDNKQLNADNIGEGPQLDYLVWGERQQFRLNFQTTVERQLNLRTRLEVSRYSQEGNVSRGILFYQDVSWKIGFKYKLTARYAIFDTDDFNSRIYAYENDILGFFSIPPYYRTGNRVYLIFNWKPTRKLEFWGRVAQSRFQDEPIVGSGLQAVSGPNQTEFKLQLRYKFGN